MIGPKLVSKSRRFKIEFWQTLTLVGMEVRVGVDSSFSLALFLSKKNKNGGEPIGYDIDQGRLGASA